MSIIQHGSLMVLLYIRQTAKGGSLLFPGERARRSGLLMNGHGQNPPVLFSLRIPVTQI